jgi:hypothetical protein
LGSNPNTVRNNIIANIRSNGPIHGIYYYYPGGSLENNTISIDDQLTSSSSTNYGIYTYGNANYAVSVLNNIISITRTGSGSKYGLYIAVSGNVISDYNDIYVNSSGTNYVGYYNGNLTSLSQFQSSGLEMNSFALDPVFSSFTANNLYPTNTLLNDQATPIGLIFDNNKAIRNQSTPDLGALEFLTPNCSGVPSANSVSAPIYSICSGEDVELGLNTLNPASGFTYQWQSSTISNVGPFTTITGATSLFYTATNVTVNTYFSVIMTCTLPGGGSISPVGTVMVSGPVAGTVPYYEGFEGIGKAGRLPDCSWSATDLEMSNLTYTSSQSNNRVPHSGTSFASFSNMSPGTSAFYTHPIQLNTGITYSAALYYATEYFGYNNWSDLSIWVGPNQSTVGMVQIVSESPAISGPYKLIDNTFTIPSSGLYYFSIRATSTSGNAVYLSWDDFSVTIPCEPGTANSPTLQVSASSQTICAGDVLALTASGADVYNWSNGMSGNAISVNPVSTGNYAVYGTNTLTGCTNTISQMIYVNPKPNVFAVANSPIVCAGEVISISAYGADSYAWSTGAGGSVITLTAQSTTNYTVIGINSFGCSSQYVQQITVNPKPTLTVLSNFPTEACKNDEVMLTAFGAQTYQWASNVSGQVYQGNPISVNIPATAIFTLTGTNAAGCKGTTTISQNISDCTSIRENRINSFEAFPNPASGKLNVVFESRASRTIVITDLLGKIVKEMKSDEMVIVVTLENLSNGVYYLKVDSDRSSGVVKVVKN